MLNFDLKAAGRTRRSAFLGVGKLQKSPARAPSFRQRRPVSGAAVADSDLRDISELAHLVGPAGVHWHNAAPAPAELSRIGTAWTVGDADGARINSRPT